MVRISVLLLVFSFFGCGSNSDKSKGNEGEDVTTVKLTDEELLSTVQKQTFKYYKGEMKMATGKMRINQKINGEMAMRNLCDKANKVYSETSPLTVLMTGDDEFTLEGSFVGSGMTFAEIEQMFVDIYDEFYGDGE